MLVYDFDFSTNGNGVPWPSPTLRGMMAIFVSQKVALVACHLDQTEQKWYRRKGGRSLELQR